MRYKLYEPKEIIPNYSLRELWWKENGIIAKLLCLFGFHAWRDNTCGWSNEDYLSCNRCMKSRDYKVNER